MTPHEPMLALRDARAAALETGSAMIAYRHLRRRVMAPAASRLRLVEMRAMAQRCVNRVDEARARR